jgi:hypothetical protein
LAPVLGDRQVNISNWTGWLIAGIGTLVSMLVFAFFYWHWLSVPGFRKSWSRGKPIVEEDLPWEDLLHLLRDRGRELAESGTPPHDDLPPEELLQLLLSRLPSLPARPPAPLPPEEADFLAGNPNRRTSRRRWGNPTEVFLNSPLWSKQVHGLVINRSLTGLAVFVDVEIQAGTVLKVRAVEAPYYVPWVDIEIKHCKKVGRNFIMGCQYRYEDIPWNVRVWFG